VPGLGRLHFITNHPAAMTPRLAGVFRDVPTVCPYLHMPAQSGSDRVLARMNRGYTAAAYLERVAMVRDANPDVAVASDFIVGFPGETEADFEATLDLVRRARFAGGFVFKYSPRPGTKAAERMDDDVPDGDKRRRHEALLDLVGEVAAEENRALVGRTVEVLVEGPSPRPNLNAGGPARIERPGWVQQRGRTRCHRLVVFDGPPDLAGAEVRVGIERASAVTLFGRLAASPQTSETGSRSRA
jgi:tRNA-2-methylthio-N6-dimethylallyladenosine synthase